MSTYHSKLLELLAIEKKANKSYLHTRISFNGMMEILLEVDHHTASYLLASTSFKEKDKYRLSLHHFWDSTEKHHVSYITKTYRDQSERIHFSCSEEYIHLLDAIKKLKHIDEILTLPFVTVHSEKTDEPQTEAKHTLAFEEMKPRKNILHISWGKFALLSFAIMILFGFRFSDLSYLNKSEQSEKVVVNAESVDKKRNELIEKKKILSDVEPDSSIETTTLPPFIELNETITYSIPKDAVALTFDDGPSKYSKEIIDILKKYQVGGTFFYIGINVKNNREAVQYAKTNGYSIGNHSMTHKQLTTLDLEKQKYELLSAKQLIEADSFENVNLFRPPYGAFNDTTVELANLNNNKLVLWNNDPEDWQSRDPDTIFQHILNSDTPGSIILLHESQAVVDVLPRVIEYLQEQNLRIVSLK